MAYDYSKLRGRIREKFKTESSMADAMGLDRSTLSKKLTNKTELTQQDIFQMASLLAIAKSEYGEYFFTQEVAI